MGHRRPKPRTIELVKSSYQPTKAELRRKSAWKYPERRRWTESEILPEPPK